MDILGEGNKLKNIHEIGPVWLGIWQWGEEVGCHGDFLFFFIILKLQALTPERASCCYGNWELWDIVGPAECNV